MNLDHFKIENIQRPVMDLTQIQPLISIPQLNSSQNLSYSQAGQELETIDLDTYPLNFQTASKEAIAIYHEIDSVFEVEGPSKAHKLIRALVLRSECDFSHTVSREM